MCICAPPRTPLEGVTVYGRRHAGDYRQVCSFLEERGVVFEFVDVDLDRTHLERAVALSGQQKAVVVEIGKQVIVGFAPGALDAALP